MKVTIYTNDIQKDYWNWKFNELKDEKQCVGIYGKGFKTKKEAVKDVERYLKEMTITEYIMEVEKRII